jgi:AhpD family alkylhydroperoxidase
MINRAKYNHLSPETYKSLLAFDKTLSDSPIEQKIRDLVKIRASQLNGCMFCLDMHVKEAALHGESELRLHHVALWHESPLFNDREKAALHWAELLTSLDHQGIEDEDYLEAAAHFSEKEISDLTLFIVSINAWNRLGVAFRPAPGSLDKLMGLDKAALR